MPQRAAITAGSPAVLMEPNFGHHQQVTAAAAAQPGLSTLPDRSSSNELR
jgi:hypothetical protein